MVRICVCSFMKLCACVRVWEREEIWGGTEIVGLKIFYGVLQPMNCPDSLRGLRYRILSNFVFKYVHTNHDFFSLCSQTYLRMIFDYTWYLNHLSCGLTCKENVSNFVGLLPGALSWGFQAAHQFRQPQWAGAAGSPPISPASMDGGRDFSIPDNKCMPVITVCPEWQYTIVYIPEMHFTASGCFRRILNKILSFSSWFFLWA